MQSLRDKLLKAGLVSEEAAKKAEADKKAPPPKARAAPPPSSSAQASRPYPPRVEAHVPKLPPLQGSKEAHRQQAKKQQQLDRQLRELVLAAEVPKDIGATTFYFVTRKNLLRRLELTEAQALRLQKGELAVVERPDPDKIEHALVPPETAKAMAALSPRAVRFLNDASGEKVGFLSDEEIASRAHEANAAESIPAPTERTAAPSDDGGWITIKRAPIEP
ncbi:MAG: DUF2058 family protein [Archangium sp.]|nr:DUF2058 family protein [Archangium sp.]